MEQNGLIYLDNAATSYPKPPEVYGEVLKALIQYGGNAGRGSHRLSMAASEKIYECRETAAELFGVSEPERVFFTLNTTHGLNTVIKGLLRRGDHVLLSDMEHNAVYRPIYKMAQNGLIGYDIFKSFCGDTERRAEKICGDIARKLRRNTRMVICTHCSNICSMTMPIAEIAELCRQSGVFFVVDGAQSAGREKISVDGMGLAALCVPGHKGLYGIQGCGAVMLGKGIALSTLTEGGNGVNSLEGGMPDFSPERYEAGTLPTPAIAGLCEGMKFIRAVGEERVAERERSLFCRARDMLGEIKRVRMYFPEYEGAVLLFNVDGLSADRVGELLNRRGICVRSGYHCSGLGHKTIGTSESGAVRASFGVFNDMRDVERLCEEVKEIAESV
ncbi:MAG: aminotransferase class V-fold PLP-dependent enzyme [Clostridia bacterium]|nr:aminotransferase class V-fold PLP-dependent enzyme [Clostridia bacterium]